MHSFLENVLPSSNFYVIIVLCVKREIKMKLEQKGGITSMPLPYIVALVFSLFSLQINALF